MKSIKILVVGINAVTGKTTSQSVGTIVHGAHGIGNHFTGHPFSFSGDDSRNCTSGRDSYLTFNLHTAKPSFQSNKKRRSFSRQNNSVKKMNAFAHMTYLYSISILLSIIFCSKKFPQKFVDKKLRQVYYHIHKGNGVFNA
jgi:hypothetical protein